MSARRGQDSQDCVRQSEVKAARDCVTNQMLHLSERLSADQRPRLPKKASARRGQDCQDSVRQLEVNAASGWVTNQMLQRSGRLSAANQRPRLAKLMSARRGQDCQDCVCRSESNDAKDCVTNQMLQLPGRQSADQRPKLPVLCLPIRGPCCKGPPTEARDAKDCVSKKRPRLLGLFSPIRGQCCEGLGQHFDASTVRDTVRQTEAKGQRLYQQEEAKNARIVHRDQCCEGLVNISMLRQLGILFAKQRPRA
jgi:hypothetical protein